MRSVSTGVVSSYRVVQDRASERYCWKLLCVVQSVAFVLSSYAPTVQPFHSFKAQLPEVDGIQNVHVDTICGVLGYKRKGADQKVEWAPPFALPRTDVVLVDEASQYDKAEWRRRMISVVEQPQLPCVGGGRRSSISATSRNSRLLLEDAV